jgi:hypothetical protein
MLSLSSKQTGSEAPPLTASTKKEILLGTKNSQALKYIENA